MGWQNFQSVIAQILQIGGNGIMDADGLRLYDTGPVPHLNHLIYSVSSHTSNFTDGAGNVILPGSTVYNISTFEAVQEYNGAITYYQSTVDETGVWNAIASVSATSSTFSIDALAANMNISIQSSGGGGTIFLVNPTNVGYLEHTFEPATAAIAGSTITFANPTGFMKAINPNDNTYAYGKSTSQGTPGQLINSTGFVQVGAQTFNVQGAASNPPIYEVEADVFYSSTAVAGAPEFQWAGTATVNHADGFNDWYGPGMVFGSGGFFVASLGGIQIGPTLSSGNHRYHSKFWVSFSNVVGPSTFTLQAATTIAADTFTIQSYYTTIRPI